MISKVFSVKLKAGLERHGLVSPITWNKRTGRIVGGHQRVSVLDSLMKSADYTLHVAAIDVEETQEKELNILLNNTTAMGDWDVTKLHELLGDTSLKIEGTGFEMADLYDMFGGNPLVQRDPDQVALEKKVESIREKMSEISQRGDESDAQDFYCVVVFKNQDGMVSFLQQAKLPCSRYQNGADIATKIGVDLFKPPDMDPDGEYADSTLVSIRTGTAKPYS